MLQERRLGAPAFEAVHFSMMYEWGKGWTLRASGRRDGCAAFDHESYERMTSGELSDVVGVVLENMLGL